MDFELSDDQVALQDAARDLLDGVCDRNTVREVVDAGGGVSPGLWEAMARQGWPGVAVPASLGGLGLGFVEAAVLLEQSGGHTAPAPFLQQIVALDALSRAASLGVDGADGLVARLLDGSSTAAIVFQPLEARPLRGGWEVSGTTEPVIYAPSASVVVVPAGTPDGEPGLYAIEVAEPPAADPAMDRTRELGRLNLEDAATMRLGGPQALEPYLDAGATAHAAEMLGGAARVLDMAVDHAKERIQFGRPIGSFQAVKHRCADMLVDVEGMRSAVYHAAWCLSADAPDASIAASTAKCWCSDASRRVMASGLQVHGGIGFTWEHDMHLYLKRAQLDQVSFGDATRHRARLAGLLRAKVEAGESVI